MAAQATNEHQKDVLQPRLPTSRKHRKPNKKTKATATTLPEPKLFQQLSRNMADKLVQDLQIPHTSPALLDRLKYPETTSIRSSTTTTTTTTTVETEYLGSSRHDNLFCSLKHNQTAQSTLSSSDSPSPTRASLDSKIYSKPRCPAVREPNSNVFTLQDFAAVEALHSLVVRYGRASHMGILDASYSFFVTRDLNAALCFKLKEHICIVGGDPLCPEELLPAVLGQFAEYRRKHNWGIIFVGASDIFLAYAKQRSWTTVQFGTERVLNPVSNPVLREASGKRIASQNRQLLNPLKGGITLGVYNPSIAKDIELQNKLVAIYDAWRNARNLSMNPQAFITVYDPFSIPGLMTYIYTMDRSGNPNGFAALRRLGANNGFHLDPCVASPSAPRGISDLLVFASMALLHSAGCSYLSFGYEPLTQPGEINGMRPWLQKLVRKIHILVCKELGVSGKKAYHDKWCPDEEQSSGLHLVFPSGTPGPQDISAVVHFANISIRSLVLEKARKAARSRNGKEKPTKKQTHKRHETGEFKEW